MKTVKEVSKLSGVSIRALHYYDTIGLLKPTRVTEAGYRLYDNKALERLQSILLFRELQFPLKAIREILDDAHFDRDKALSQQITLLEMKMDHIQKLLELAREIQKTGVNRTMDFSAFDTRKMEEYARQAKAAWGNTDAYREFEQKDAARTEPEKQDINAELMAHFARFGQLKGLPPEDARVQALVAELRSFITAHYYNCTPKILAGQGAMYAAGDEMTENIDKAGGPGTAEFASRAIACYCSRV